MILKCAVFVHKYNTIFNLVGSLGLIGGGALAFAATALIGQSFIAPAGFGALGK